MLKLLGKFEIKQNESVPQVLKIAKEGPGIKETEKYFYHQDADGKVDWVVSRVCDHAGGRLCLANNSKAVCPLHHWELDLNTLKYTNGAGAKEKLAFKQNGELQVEDFSKSLTFKRFTTRSKNLTMRFLAHASVAFECNGYSIVTDPWLLGPCFILGWWHKVPPKKDALDILKSANAIYISHNHPDHMHEETLKYVSRDALIITPAFKDNATCYYLEKWGFKNVQALQFNNIYQLAEGIEVSILQSGDFRNDSGLFISMGGKRVLLSVDSNILNNLVLPENIDLLCCSFAGGASGYPLCWEMYSEAKTDIVLRNKTRNILQQVELHINAARPKAFMPYAGFFTEANPADRYILDHNQKNSVSDVEAMVTKKFPDVQFIDPIWHDRVQLKDDGLDLGSVDLESLYQVDSAYVAKYVEAYKAQYSDFSTQELEEYFSRQTFRSQLTLYLQPTDENCKPEGTGLVMHFSNGEIETGVEPATLEDLYQKAEASLENRHLFIKVRKYALAYVVRNSLSWEDIAIGFQAKFKRKPDIYNADFWFYFSNQAR